jgi:hypothetical protein
VGLTGSLTVDGKIVQLKSDLRPQSSNHVQYIFIVSATTGTSEHVTSALSMC